DWWAWLLFSGVSLGLVASVKWVGLFSVALVGLYTLADLFIKLGDTSMPVRRYAKHWVARIIGLIIVPIIIYMFSFALHFAVLNRSGDGDAQMSSLFQAGLRGSDLVDNPLEVVYGSAATLRTSAYGAGLLHSHIQSFPVGSQQQQVTTYGHKDENNYWIMERGSNQTAARLEAGLGLLDDPLEPLKHGSTVRLFHNATKAYLHVNNLPAPMTKTALEVACLKGEEAGHDRSYEWRVELVDDLSGRSPAEIHALTTRFHLRHVEHNCLLRAHSKNLPEWGFKQGEVVCDSEHGPGDAANIWNVEWHRNAKLPPAPPSSFRTSFTRDFIHLNAAMWTSNNALVPDDTREDRATSKAWEWPLMLVGMRMAGWGDDQVKFLLLGNPAVWWTSTLCILLIGILVVLYDARRRRGYNGWLPEEYENFLFGAYVIAGGWFFHYIPFFIMGRVLYLHHYLPALYISTLGIPFVIDHCTRRATITTQRIVYSSVVMLVICTFAYFAPLTFGYNKPIEDMRGRSWLKKWQVVDYPLLSD
ncbi:family 39 glycosyltransferase, partial [Syncephalis pseudoplumigaleata]